jgi:hypothetical protein
LFVSVEILNEVLVLSTVDGHQVASIPVGFPAGIDESSDGKAVYVVSPFFSGITIIDPGLLQVVGHATIPASVSGKPVGSSFFQVATLSNGTVLLLEPGELNGILQWTPATDEFVQFGSASFLQAAGLISRSADHTKVLGFAGFGGGMLYDANPIVLSVPTAAFPRIRRSIPMALRLSRLVYKIPPLCSMTPTKIPSLQCSWTLSQSRAWPIASTENLRMC